MLFRALIVAILFAVPAAAQQQEQGMMDRIMNPNRDRANPMGEKAFSSSPFAASEFRGSREYGGLKSAPTKEYATRVFLASAIRGSAVVYLRRGRRRNSTATF